MKIISLLILLAVKSLYLPLNRRASKFYWELPIDRRIPLIPLFLIPYLFYFIFTVIAITAAWNTSYIYDLLSALTISYLLAIPIWYFLPNGVRRPTITHNSHLHRVLKFIYAHDGDSNGFPSAHVYVVLICAHYLSLVLPQFLFIFTAIALLIILSTLFTKQHYVIDIPGGILIYLLSIGIVLLV